MKSSDFAVEAELSRLAAMANWEKGEFQLLPEAGGQQSLPFRLKGSQQKTAYALRRNVDDMIRGNATQRLTDIELQDGRWRKVWVAEKPENLNCVGFLTLTVGDTETVSETLLDGSTVTRERFVQVWDAAEANRRINNLNRRVLGELFERAVIVTERHKNGAIHYHAVGILKGRPDIRSGFDFVAVAQRDYRSVSNDLRAVWERLREVLPRYGFGRSELTPIRSTGEAIASYVSKYIEKNLFNRRAEDKHKKLVRYLGWEKSQLKPNEFSWCTPQARQWRCRVRVLAGLVGITEKEDMPKRFGPRWSFRVTNVIQEQETWPVPFWEMMDGELNLCAVLMHEQAYNAHQDEWERPEARAATDSTRFWNDRANRRYGSSQPERQSYERRPAPDDGTTVLWSLYE